VLRCCGVTDSVPGRLTPPQLSPRPPSRTVAGLPRSAHSSRSYRFLDCWSQPHEITVEGALPRHVGEAVGSGPVYLLPPIMFAPPSLWRDQYARSNGIGDNRS